MNMKMMTTVSEFMQKYPTNNIIINVLNSAGECIESKKIIAEEYHDNIILNSTMDQILESSRETPDEFIRCAIYINKLDVALKLVQTYGPGKIFNYILKHGDMNLFTEILGELDTFDYTSFLDLFGQSIFMRRDELHKSNRLKEYCRENCISYVSVWNDVLCKWDCIKNNIPMSVFETRLSKLCGQMFDEIDHIEMISDPNYKKLMALVGKKIPIKKTLNIIHMSIEMHNDLAFENILLGVAFRLRDNELLDIFKKIMIHGTIKSYIAFVKCVTIKKMKVILYPSGQCQSIMNEFSKFGDAKIFKDMSEYWSEMLKTYADISAMISNAAFHNRIDMIECLEDYVLKNRTSVTLKRFISLVSLSATSGNKTKPIEYLKSKEEYYKTFGIQ